MPRRMHNTTSLPRGLRSELGIRDTYGEKKRKQKGPATRKDRRKAERDNKKSRTAVAPAQKKFQRIEESEDEEEDVDDLDLDEDDDISSDDARPTKKPKPTTEAKPKPALKSKKSKDLEPASDSDSDDSQGYEDDAMNEDTPESTVHVSAGVKSKLAQDDAEIAALEKKLGLKKGKKLPKAFAEDGLEDLMGDLGEESEDDTRKRKREADEWLLSKRRKAQALQAKVSEDEEDEDEEDEDDDDELDSDEDDNLDDEIFGMKKPLPKKKENPYIAPVAKAETTQKYIPPSMRARQDPESESLTRLRRQAQGQLNKLSEANLISIVGEFEKLYRDYPRQNVTSTLINLLMGMICERAVLQDTFMVLHAGFIAALYKLIGIDFGAELVQHVVEILDAGADERGKFEGKEIVNLVSLLSQLYNFHVIGSTLIFDYIRLFLGDINETNTELLLKVIRNCGPQLRQDDPSSLKDIVLLIQPAVAKAGEAALSVRTKFMIDVITDLKNNKVKSAIGASVTSEHITKMRKVLGSLNNSRVIRASEPISISRADIHDSSKKGKWWLVGASWKDDPLVAARKELAGAETKKAQVEEDDSEAEPDLGDLAKAHRMNTDVRRSIFVAIMSANDFQDAHVRLLKLRLKRAQEFEIPRRRIKMSFMFALWNIFKRMGEKSDLDEDDDFDPDDEENGVSMKAVVNVAKMYGMLIADGSLTLGILKNLNFAYLQTKTKTFVEILIISIIQQSQKTKRAKKKADSSESTWDEESLMQIFLRVQETPHVAKGLIYFVRKVVAKSDIVTDKEQKLVRWGCNVAVDALKAVKD
ncbi:uncharacterized protein N7477_006791 [Penicillium maclennaniae]|uniref:uncharacterized protein n=1 Tax=Penicillium maclennaniae TaxID=1343394 RepID=UPI002540281D|nr:uncharacterized protein N7477_006791 [Penicillium maclennaniae]KAJ5668221.1 hypothetical protein N7477_006791 [Penicillium maclennaniae]